ncbi:MAG: flippase activity-associated protein Agl23 [Pyrinomonadaceae bacterium]
MTTGSTKSRNRKQKRRSDSPARKINAPAPEAAPEAQTSDLSERTWLIASVSILAVAAILRIYNLNLVPLHHDEGVNGNFLVRLVREGFYHYDPANYHGPTLYYFAAIIPWILRFFFGVSAQDAYGLNTVTMRLVPALFGLATVWLVLTLRRHLGTLGVLCGAALLAVSPGAVYLSRYFIHETLFTFFTLGIVVASLKYYEDRSPVYLVLAAVSAALLFATKETAVISAAVLLIALVTTHLYRWLTVGYLRLDPQTSKRGRSKRATPNNRVARAVERLGGPMTLAILALGAIVVFLGTNFLFYSSFLTNYPGVHDALKTFEFWTKTGKEAHGHPPETYVVWLLRQETPLLFLGPIGAAIVLWKPRNTFALFSALWAFGLLAAYSLISYKTPWLVLNFVVPLALISGYALQMIYDLGLGQMRLIIGIMVLAIGLSGYKTIDLNFINYDNDDPHYVYVYAHTRRETLALVDEIKRIAERTKQGKQLGITIVSPDYWPLPWYLRDYTRVGYHGSMTDSNEPVIIASESQAAEIQAKFGDRFEKINSGFNAAGGYPLRPGVNLLLYLRRDSLGSSGVKQ